jgi:hypothetical protein
MQPRGAVHNGASDQVRKEVVMPAKSEKQRKFMGAELARKRAGKKTQTGMSEKELEKYASKKKSS